MLDIRTMLVEPVSVLLFNGSASAGKAQRMRGFCAAVLSGERKRLAGETLWITNID